MRMTLALAAALVLGVPAMAAAQEIGRLAEADANGDGALSRAEVRAARERAFAGLDTNADGYLSSAERAGVGRRMARRLENADADNDGRVARVEFMAQPMPAFDRFDRDDNDVLDASELEALHRAAQTFGGQ